MKHTTLTLSLLFLLLLSCNKTNKQDFAMIVTGDSKSTNSTEYEFNPEGKTILERFPAYEYFKVIEYTEYSFGNYLQNLPLKNYGERVKYFNGLEKTAENIYLSVIDMPISNRDLQQCADAVMRLKAEYHFNKKEYDKIHFNFLSDGKPRYFKDYANGDYSFDKFMNYMNYVMAFANTSSLKNELQIININDIEVGDIFIQQGTPYGHAVIVVNVAKNEKGEKQFMLAQSYMPAQETHILLNPKKIEVNPWYDVEAGKIKTPEWTFSSSDLHRFP